MTHTFKLNSFETWQDKFKKHMWKFYAIWLIIAIYKRYTITGSNDYSIWRILAPVFLLVIGLKDAFFPEVRSGSFLDIDSEMVSWKIRPVLANNKIFWGDIEWIKFENDAITFYEKNSFRKFLNLSFFNLDDLSKIKQLLTEIAIEKNIKLIA